MTAPVKPIIEKREISGDSMRAFRALQLDRKGVDLCLRYHRQVARLAPRADELRGRVDLVRLHDGAMAAETPQEKYDVLRELVPVMEAIQ